MANKYWNPFCMISMLELEMLAFRFTDTHALSYTIGV